MKRTIFVYQETPAYPILTKWCSRIPGLAGLVCKMDRHTLYRRNPRGRDYMFSAASEKFPEFGPSALVTPDEIGQVDWSSVSQTVFVWTDANGLGWSPVEKRILRVASVGTRLVVLNGRCRTFDLTRQEWRSLRRRRFLEKTFLMDLVATASFLVVTPFLLVLDLTRGKR